MEGYLQEQVRKDFYEMIKTDTIFGTALQKNDILDSNSQQLTQNGNKLHRMKNDSK